MSSDNKLERQYITDLKGVFEAQGTQLYEGQHTLCLTNHCLNCILKRLSTFQHESRETTIRSASDLKCIAEGLSKVKLLKLITDRKYTFPPSLINLDISPFKSLQFLTLKRVPFNSLSGLQRLREQLCSLVIEKCGVTDIDDVIVKCGRDEARPFVWNCLKELDLSSNSITSLRGALQYLPALDRVSFSCNRIGESPEVNDTSSSSSLDSVHQGVTDGIKFIDSVTWLHLGYNRLTSVPVFGDKAKFVLTSLILRNNSLTDIEGVQVLEALNELDIAENLISDFVNLTLLHSLQNLSQLILMGNPVTFDPKYRVKTAQCLSHSVTTNTFVLDYKKLSTAEKKAIPPLSLKQYQGPPGGRGSIQYLTSPRGSTTSSTSSLSLSLSNDTVEKRSSTGNNEGIENDGLPSESTPIKVGERTGKRSSVAKSPRLITFEEDTPTGEVNDPLSTTPLKHGETIKRNQHLRSQLRASWLTISNISNEQASSRSKPNLPSILEPTQPDSQPTDTAETQSQTSTGMGYSIIRTQSETTSSMSVSTNSERTVSEQANLSHDSTSHENTSHDHVSHDQVPSQLKPVLSNDQSFRSPLMLNSHHNEDSDIVAVSQTKTKRKKSKRKSKPSITISDTTPNNTTTVTTTTTTNTVSTDTTSTEYISSVMPAITVSKTITDNNEDTTSTINGVGMFDMEENDEENDHQQQLSDPKVPANCFGDMYHVVLYDSASEDDEGLSAGTVPASMDPEFIILSDRFIQEVTLNGDVQDQLDLQCLTSARVKSRKRRNTRCRVLVLQFNYERRDRRKREYVLSAYDDESKIMKVLEPIIEQNTADVSIARKLECLKCQVVIDWSEALDDPSVTSPTPLTPSSSLHSPDPNSWSKQNKICPRCKEGYLICQTGTEYSAGSQKRTQSHTGMEPDKPSKQSFGFNMADTNVPQPISNNEPDLLSPGHMNVAIFDTYPEPLTEDHPSIASDTQEQAQGSPLPDTGPFGLHLDRTPQRDGMGVVNGNHGNGRDESTPGRDESTPVAMKQEFGISPVTIYTQIADHDDVVNGSNPFSDDNPLYNGLGGGRDDVGVVNQSPEPSGLAVRGSPSSKSLSWSHFKPGADSVEELESVSLNQSNRESKLRKTSSDSSSKTNKSSVSNSPTGSRRSPSMVSASVPSENAGFMSLFRRPSKEKRVTSHHSRTKSQDLQIKVPPLPEQHSVHLREQDPPTHSPRLIDSPLSSQYKSGSQSSLTSEGRGQQHHRGNERYSSGEERKGSSGSGSGRFKGFSIKRKSVNKKIGKLSSSDAEEGGSKPVNAEFVLYRNKDPTYLHSNIVLHLKMYVFDNDYEEFHLALKSTVIEYGAWNETESFLIISSSKAYLYKIIGPENLEVDSWLELVCVLELSELVYIEIGVCYQSIRLEFDDPPRCYTFMIGIEELCRKIFDSLSYVVSDIPHNLFKSIRVTQFSFSHLTDPHEVLRKQLMDYYDSSGHALSGRKPSSSGTIDTSSTDENLQVFVLGQKYNYNDRRSASVLVTLVLSDKHLYIGVQNPQWPFPALHFLPDKDDLLPPFSGVIQKEISDVEGLVLFDDNNLQMTIKFFYEGTGTRPPSSSWTLILKCSKSMTKFVNCLKTSWSKEFQQDLPIMFK